MLLGLHSVLARRFGFGKLQGPVIDDDADKLLLAILNDLAHQKAKTIRVRKQHVDSVSRDL